jgi:hypothetical protein
VEDSRWEDIFSEEVVAYMGEIVRDGGRGDRGLPGIANKVNEAFYEAQNVAEIGGVQIRDDDTILGAET